MRRTLVNIIGVLGLVCGGVFLPLWQVGSIATEHGTASVLPVSEPVSLRPIAPLQHEEPVAETAFLQEEGIPTEDIPHPVLDSARTDIRNSNPQSYPALQSPLILEKHKRIAASVLDAMPEACRGVLQNFFVRYEGSEKRGLAGKTTMILDGTVPDDEFGALFIHELGHVMDLNPDVRCLGGSAASGRSVFQDGPDPVYNDDPSAEFYAISWLNAETPKSNVTGDDFASGYAQTNPFEDFSESFAYFLLQNEAFKARADANPVMKRKYEWFRTHLFPQVPQLARGFHVWGGKVPWDATKLPYQWL